MLFLFYSLTLPFLLSQTVLLCFIFPGRAVLLDVSGTGTRVQYFALSQSIFIFFQSAQGSFLQRMSIFLNALCKCPQIITVALVPECRGRPDELASSIAPFHCATLHDALSVG